MNTMTLSNLSHQMIHYRQQVIQYDQQFTHSKRFHERLHALIRRDEAAYDLYVAKREYKILKRASQPLRCKESKPPRLNLSAVAHLSPLAHITPRPSPLSSDGRDTTPYEELDASIQDQFNECIRNYLESIEYAKATGPSGQKYIDEAYHELEKLVAEHPRFANCTPRKLILGHRPPAPSAAQAAASPAACSVQ